MIFDAFGKIEIFSGDGTNSGGAVSSAGPLRPAPTAFPRGKSNARLQP